MNRLKEKYLKEVVPSLQEKYNYKSIMEVPKYGCWRCHYEF